jgi:hypothetical protein
MQSDAEQHTAWPFHLLPSDPDHSTKTVEPTPPPLLQQWQRPEPDTEGSRSRAEIPPDSAIDFLWSIACSSTAITGSSDSTTPSPESPGYLPVGVAGPATDSADGDHIGPFHAATAGDPDLFGEAAWAAADDESDLFGSIGEPW